MCSSASTSQPETREHTSKTCAIRLVAMYATYRFASPSKRFPGKMLANARMLLPNPSSHVWLRTDNNKRIHGNSTANKPGHEYRHVGRRSAPTRKSQTQAKQTDRRGPQPARHRTAAQLLPWRTGLTEHRHDEGARFA